MAIPRTPAFLGKIPVFGPQGPDREESDFRNVPASDCGNADYTDAGMLGTYQTDAEPFRDPPDVRHFTGYGATAADLDRGYVVPAMREDPAYDLGNYKQRWADPKESYVDEGQTDLMPDDWEFRNRNRRSKGFLTRPRIPTERG